jgi:hypothetical protein
MQPSLFFLISLFLCLCQAGEEKGKFPNGSTRKVRDEREGGTSEHVPGLRDEVLIGRKLSLDEKI